MASQRDYKENLFPLIFSQKSEALDFLQLSKIPHPRGNSWENVAPTALADVAYDVGLNHRKALMGESDLTALVQSLRVFGIACFVC